MSNSAHQFSPQSAAPVAVGTGAGAHTASVCGMSHGPWQELGRRIGRCLYGGYDAPPETPGSRQIRMFRTSSAELGSPDGDPH
jgi:hypothetical protein